MTSVLSRRGRVSNVACIPELVLHSATTWSRVAAGKFGSSLIGADPQPPLGVERVLELSAHVRSVATGSWRIDWYPAGATVNAKCGIIGRSEETAALPTTGPNRPERS